LPRFDVPTGLGLEPAEVFHTRMPGTSADVFLLGSPRYFFRDGIYDDPGTREGFLDNMQRFVFYMRAALELLIRLGRRCDVIHCNDWQTGLVPGLLRTSLKREPLFARTGTLFTLHNLAYQGMYPLESLELAGIDRRFFYPHSPFEFWGKVNFLKVGIEFSDLLNTVSETYALEIQTSPEFGHGLEGSLRARRNDLFGIVNGIDYEEWNPETDPLIPARFSARDLSGKASCKRQLLAHFGLASPAGRVPLAGMVSRLADQKGFDLLSDALEDLMREDLQLVILGSGRHKYEQLLLAMARRYPDRVGVFLGYDNRLAHWIEAGADMFLMPSRYEPCGLNQLYSLRYGTVPVVRATGGLADTVRDFDFDSNVGTGFCFRNYTSQELLIAVRRALLAFSEPALWDALVRRGMAEDWSWERSARRYLELYQRLFERKHPAAG
jgi:starch synthase